MPAPRLDVEHLILQREARGLAWSIISRLSFLAVPTLGNALHVAGWLPAGVAAQNDQEAWIALLLLSAVGMLAVGALRQVQRLKHVRTWGRVAVTVDVAVIAALPLIWVGAAFDGPGTPVFVAKNELFGVVVVLMVVNTLPLRATYPAIIAGAGVVVHVVIYAMVLCQPDVVITTGFIEHFTTPAVAPGVVGGRLLAMVLMGTFLAAIGRSARKTIREAVQLQAANHEIRERQAQLLMEGRLSALSRLVGGIAHEMNSPLGALRSSLNTSTGALHRLKSADATRAEQLWQAAEGSLQVADEAAGRVADLTSSLRSFAKLDDADTQRIDLAQELENVLRLIPRERLGAVRMKKTFDSAVHLECRPRELNQMFMTLIENALDALNGRGTLMLEIRHDAEAATLIIADDGPGMTAEQLDGLFELRFETKGTRVGMGLGLPLSQRIVAAHGGDISVKSTLGAGTCFTVRLPKSVTLPSPDQPTAAPR